MDCKIAVQYTFRCHRDTFRFMNTIREKYNQNKKDILRLEKENAEIIAKHPEIENPDATLDMRTPAQKAQIEAITPKDENRPKHW